jgi:nucleotide-binding universal stress UspA family protein
MSNQQNILLATDLSAHSAAAAAWAYTYARATGAKIILAHIVEISIPNWFKDAYSVAEDKGQLAKLEALVHDWYSKATEGAKADSVVVRVGHPHEQLRELVPELDLHMIVVAQSGKGAIERVMSGSLARSLAAVPPCAVVIVDPSHQTASARMEITVATDLTEKAEQALLFGAYLTRIFGGQLDVIAVTLASALPFVQQGKLRALALSSQDRSPLAPDIPTFRDSGMPELKNFAVENYYGLLAPGATPDAVVKKVEADVRAVLQDPDLRKKLAGAGLDPFFRTGADTAKLLRADVERYRRIAGVAGIKQE